jgi:transcriptional pleiotropic regulator of transition state genes
LSTQKQVRIRPSNAESMRNLLIGIMEESLPGIDRIRDREWVLREIDRLRNPKQLSGRSRNIKPTGVVRQVDELGRIVVPKELRRTLGINEKDSIEIYTEGEWIILEKANHIIRCTVCGSIEDLNPFKTTVICESCIGELFDSVQIGG